MKIKVTDKFGKVTKLEYSEVGSATWMNEDIGFVEGCIKTRNEMIKNIKEKLI